MLSTGYFVKITEINSQQKKKKSVLITKIIQLVPAKHKNRQSAKNKLPQTFRATW